MGKKGREIVEYDVQRLIERLNSAYADEWLAVYYYTVGAQLATGMKAALVAGKLRELAKEELEHQEELAERILQLGGEPIRSIDELVEKANCRRVDIPEDPRDLKGLVEAVAEAERCAIDVYNGMLKNLMSVGKDPITFHTIRHIMQEEVHHEEEMENLLGL